MDLGQKIKLELESNHNYNYLIEKLNKYRIYVAGGCIRNIFLNKPIKDIDLFFNSTLSELSYYLEQMLEYGKLIYGPFGSPRWKPSESDIYFDIVPFSNFIVNNKEYTDISEVLIDFDITINAIGYDIKTEKIIDPLNGIADIKQKIIRATHLDFPDFVIKDGKNEISSLSVFWFRLLHYRNVLEFKFDEATLNWVRDNKFRYKDLHSFQEIFFNPIIADDFLIDVSR